MHFVYIIKSLKSHKYYVGESKNTETRLLWHNNPELNKSSTKSGIPWKIIFKIKCQSRNQAIKIEKHIKRMKSRPYIENLCRYPEMTEKLLNTYKIA